ncbi:hypothetical protein ABTZ46_21385 [Nocardioides sp. NPDC126508]
MSDYDRIVLGAGNSGPTAATTLQISCDTLEFTQEHDHTADGPLAWGRDQMASYKYPRLVLEELPMTSTGKVLKRALVEQS